jgi:PST family polysaccharide transporter
MTDSTKSRISWLLAEKVMRVLVGAFVSTAVARSLGPEDFGGLAISMGFVSIAVAAANMGADHIHISEFARRDAADGREFLGSAMFVRFCWSIVCLFVFWAALAASDVNNRNVLLILSIGVPISAFAIFAGDVQGRGEFRTYSILSSVSIAFGALLRVAGIWAGASISYFAIVTVLESAVMTLMLAGQYQFGGTTNLLWLRAKRSRAVSYFKMCMPTAISATLVVIYLRFELFMIDELIGKAAAGVWSAALMFTAPWSMLAASILPVANRRLAIEHGEESAYERSLVSVLRWMLLLAAAAAIINCAAVAVLAPLLLGPKFGEVAPIVFITSLSLIPLFSGTVQELWLAHRRSTGIVLAKVLVGLPASAALYYLIVPSFSLRGAAVAMVLSYCLTAFVLNGFFDKRFFRIQLRALGL